MRPDLTTFGKVIGGGLPIGAVGGRAEIMETLSPLGPVFHAGTLAGNPLATAAGLAALDQLTDDVYIELMARARHLSSLLARGVRCRRARRRSSRWSARWSASCCGDDAAAVRTSTRPSAPTRRLYAAFFHAMLAEGVALAPGAYEAMFVGLGARRRGDQFDRRSSSSCGPASRVGDCRALLSR